jgi:starch synthase
MGWGLDGLLRLRAHDLTGILNGIDTQVWNPRTDPLIPWRFSEKSMWRKEKDKEVLLQQAGLVYQKGVPIIGVVSRLTGQKGIELLAPVMGRRLEGTDARLVALGSGEPKLEKLLTNLAETFPDKVFFHRGYDERLAHLIEAGADMFLMPSFYEPSGLNQMYSLAYGTAPIVRRTGGLADTVEPYDIATGEGNGFTFEQYTEAGLAWALDEALKVYSQRTAWQQLQRNAMAVDNSWLPRAAQYGELYARLAG